MYHALPKDNDGGLDHGFVRYALHRFFVQQQGRHVNGFDPEGELWNATTATEMLKERVPLHVQELVGKNLRRWRAQLKEVAVPAATLDDLVHSEAIERLADASSVHGKSVGGDLNEDDRPIKLYTICCIEQCEEFLSHLENKFSALQSSHHTLALLLQKPPLRLLIPHESYPEP